MKSLWELEKGADPREVLDALIENLPLWDHLGDAFEALEYAAKITGLKPPHADHDDECECGRDICMDEEEAPNDRA